MLKVIKIPIDKHEFLLKDWDKFIDVVNELNKVVKGE